MHRTLHHSCELDWPRLQSNGLKRYARPLNPTQERIRGQTTWTRLDPPGLVRSKHVILQNRYASVNAVLRPNPFYEPHFSFILAFPALFIYLFFYHFFPSLSLRHEGRGASISTKLPGSPNLDTAIISGLLSRVPHTPPFLSFPLPGLHFVSIS